MCHWLRHFALITSARLIQRFKTSSKFMEDNIVLVAISATVRLVGKMKLIKESKRDYLHCTILSTKQTEISTKPFHEACSS